MKFFSSIQSIRKDKLTVLDLASLDVTKGSALDVVRLDSIISEEFSNPALKKNKETIAIVNTTKEGRLGTRVARSLSVMGMDVIRVTDAQQPIQETRLAYAKDIHASESIAHILRDLFLLKKEHLHVDEQVTNEYRSDYVLFLGEDAAKMFAITR